MPTLTRRCFSSSPVTDSLLTIDGQEAHHLLHVLRIQPGDPLTLFDGSGHEFLCEVRECRRSEVILQVEQQAVVDRELPIILELGVALPKGDRSRWLVEKCVELGVSRLVPLATEFCDLKAKGESRKKLNRYVVEASKQCGRNKLMEIEELTAFEDWARDAPQESIAQLIAHPGGEPFHSDEFCQAGELSGAGAVRLAVGPEGGFSESEIKLAQELGWRVVDLGPRILRVETAALKLVASIAR